MSQTISHTQIAIIGGGVSGICSAYFLAQAGYDVTVIERHNNVAEEATLANSGLMAPASISPLALPSLLSTVVNGFLQATPAIVSKKRINSTRWTWHRKSRSDTLHAYAQHKDYLTRLTQYGQLLIHSLQQQHALEEENVMGVLRIFRKASDAQRANSVSTILEQHDLKADEITKDQITHIEPNFNPEASLVSARYAPNDEVGNCVLFVKQLKTITQALGVKFLFNSPVQSIERQDNNSIHIHCRDLTLRAEAVVVCAGVQSASLVKPLGITLPLYPAESYSSVFNLKTTEYAPSLTLIDETNRVSIARLGNRLRLTGLIGFVPHTLTPHKKAVHALHKIGYELFPNAVNYSSATSWSRTIALTPNGLPLLGATSHGNIFINTGHGINGWAAAVASAKILSDHLLERPTEIDVTGLFNHI